MSPKQKITDAAEAMESAIVDLCIASDWLTHAKAHNDSVAFRTRQFLKEARRYGAAVRRLARLRP